MQEKNQSEIGLSPSFIVDGMLFGLAKWLVMLGYDAQKKVGGNINIMSDEGNRHKIFLTMSLRHDEDKPENSFIIKNRNIWEQVKEVTEAFPINYKNTFLSRCSKCNVLLDKVEIDKVKENLPEFTASHIKECRRCPRCLRLYWEGTHCENMRLEIKNKLKINI